MSHGLPPQERLAELEAYIAEHGHRPDIHSSLGMWITNVIQGAIKGDVDRERVADIQATVPTPRQYEIAQRPTKLTSVEKRAELLASLRSYIEEHRSRPPQSHPLWWSFYTRVNRARDADFIALWESTTDSWRGQRRVRFGIDGQEYEIVLDRAGADALRTLLTPYARAARLADPHRPKRAPRPQQVRIGDHASMTGDDGLLECLYCGYRAQLLTPHLKHAHGVTAAEYRAEHKLPASASMMSDSLRAQAAEKRRQMLADDPTMLDHLKPYSSSEHTSTLSRLAADSVRESHKNPIAHEHRAPGRAYAVQRMVEQRLAKLDAAAQLHDYKDAADAVARTMHLSAYAAAKKTGLSPQTITRRRDELDDDAVPPSA